MKSDFSDLRFTNAAENTLLDSWMESHTASTSAVIWVETNTPANNVDADIYMYYGNSGVASNWNGANTFLQYHGTATADFIDSLVIDPTNNYAFETIIRINADTHNIEVGLGRDIGYTGDKAFIQSYSLSSNNLRLLQTLNNGTATQVSEAPKLTTNQWYRGLITFDGTTIRGYWDSNEISGGSTTNLPDQLMGMFLHDVSGGCETKWSFVRKYTTNPPTYAFGVEPAMPTGVTQLINGGLVS